MKKLTLLVIPIVSLLVNAKIHAASTNLSQSVLPLECYVNSINSGTGINVLVTPEGCVEVLPAENPQVIYPNTYKESEQNNPSKPIATNSPTSEKPSSPHIGNTVPDQIKEDPKIALILISGVAVLYLSLVKFYKSNDTRK